MTSISPPTPRTGVLSASVPIAAAIGVFGVVYGAAATQVMGPTLTVLSSALTFSGAAQFATVGLLAAGATPAGVLGAVASLALRHVPLGAVVRPRLTVRMPWDLHPSWSDSPTDRPWCPASDSSTGPGCRFLRHELLDEVTS
jgi:predicted branched-subunit amino acid permease